MAEQEPDTPAGFGCQSQPPRGQAGYRSAIRYARHTAPQRHLQRPQARGVILHLGKQAARRVQPQPGQPRRIGSRF